MPIKSDLKQAVKIETKHFSFDLSAQKTTCKVCGEVSPPYGLGVIEWEEKHRQKHAKRIRTQTNRH